MAADIFISYRGADRVIARKLEHRLRSRWGSRVFRDETGLTPGMNWADGLGDALKNASVIIALIGPGWHVSSDESVEDWVRKELETAIRNGKPILAVLVGDVDTLRPKLSNMPEAFQRQAVAVGPELAGFDVHQIAKAVSQLAEFSSDLWTPADRRDEMVPELAFDNAVQAIDEGRSLFIRGSSGSGRNALVRKLVNKLRSDNHLVACHGLVRGGGTRHTHAVISGWIYSLAEAFQDPNSDYCSQTMKESLVEAVLEAGPDLLSRRVVKASTLLPLGETKHDQRILEAVRRPRVRWAPFPPTRLRNQSLQVIERVVDDLTALHQRTGGDQAQTGYLAPNKLIFVIDHFDNVDSVSSQLAGQLMKQYAQSNQSYSHVQFVVGAYEAGRNSSEAIKWLSESDGICQINIEDKEKSWGEELFLRRWLDAHRIELTKTVANCIQSEDTPYRAFAKLWYLVDNGFVGESAEKYRETIGKKTTTSKTSKKTTSSKKPNHSATNNKTPNEKIIWDAVGEGKAIVSSSRDGVSANDILDHMIEEHIPVGFRRLIEAGALQGRVFSFHAAYAVAHPGAEDEEPLNKREVAKWLKEADEQWEKLKGVDPDKSVINCAESDNGECLVSLAQAELIGHLQRKLNPSIANVYHARLARYLVDPIKKLANEDYGREYHRADLAAKHWTMSGELRHAADAHRRAAQLAEISLAFGESQEHYREAIRLYTQLIADHGEPEREHEDLLILANCFYRVGQSSRLAGHLGAECHGAIQYLNFALHRLAELKTILLKNEPNRWPEGPGGARNRGIPGPNLVRHYLRVYNALCGHVHLELAQCHEAVVRKCRSNAGSELHECKKCRESNGAIRARLFDALRHAEAGQGEAGSRWLLAAASARLASLLANEALRWETKKAELASELAIEAFFHIERIIGLEPYSENESNELEDPVSVAWRTAGRLFRHRAQEPRIAEWCYRKMNDHADNVSTTVDMITDRWLGGFLLSICNSRESAELDEARGLLERHLTWVIECGLTEQQASSHLRLYLLELVASYDKAASTIDMSRQNIRLQHLENAQKVARQFGLGQYLRDCRLFMALEEVLSQTSDKKNLDRIFEEIVSREPSNKNKTYAQIGALQIAGLILRRVPAIVHSLDPILSEQIGGSDENYRYLKERAEEYCRNLSHSDRLLSPCVDSSPRRHPKPDRLTAIQLLAKWRMPRQYFEDAKRTSELTIHELREHFREFCESEENESIDVLCRDAEYAAMIHNWYAGTDPARLITLASEWNLTITGEEWSNPRLLQGRLATNVLKKVYDAELVLGKHRFDRITKMVENSVVGKEKGASAIEMVFYLANGLLKRDRNRSGKEKNRRPRELKDLGKSLPGDGEAQKEKLESLYADLISQEKQGLWESGYVPTLSEQTEMLGAAEWQNEIGEKRNKLEEVTHQGNHDRE